MIVSKNYFVEHLLLTQQNFCKLIQNYSVEFCWPLFCCHNQTFIQPLKLFGDFTGKIIWFFIYKTGFMGQFFNPGNFRLSRSDYNHVRKIKGEFLLKVDTKNPGLTIRFQVISRFCNVNLQSCKKISRWISFKKWI